MSSTYSSIFGHNPYAEWFLGHLGIRKEEIGRFRDASLYKENGLYIVRVLTRNAGSRQKFQRRNEKLSRHPLYLRQEIEPSDDTYLYFFFKMPMSMVDELAAGKVDLDAAAAAGDYWLVDNRDLKRKYVEAGVGKEEEADEPEESGEEPQAAKA